MRALLNAGLLLRHLALEGQNQIFRATAKPGLILACFVVSGLAVAQSTQPESSVSPVLFTHFSNAAGQRDNMQMLRQI